LAVLILWWLLTATGTVNAIVLPAPTAAWEALHGLLLHPADTLPALWTTLRSLIIAFAIAAPIGVALGVSVGRSALLREAYEPLLSNLNTVPVIVLYPLLAGLIGLGSAPQVLVGILACLMPVAIASTWAARDVDPTLVSAARSMGAGHWALVRAVSLPTALPGILTGLRTGLGLAFVTIIAGEFISSTEGIGYQLAQTSQAFRTPELFSWIVIALATSAVVNGVWSVIHIQIERRVSR